MPFDGPEVVHLPPSRDGSMPSVFFVNTQRPKERYNFIEYCPASGNFQ